MNKLQLAEIGVSCQIVSHRSKMMRSGLFHLPGGPCHALGPDEIAGTRGGVGKCQFCLLSNFFKCLPKGQEDVSAYRLKK